MIFKYTVRLVAFDEMAAELNKLGELGWDLVFVDRNNLGLYMLILKKLSNAKNAGRTR